MFYMTNVQTDTRGWDLGGRRDSRAFLGRLGTILAFISLDARRVLLGNSACLFDQLSCWTQNPFAKISNLVGRGHRSVWSCAIWTTREGGDHQDGVSNDNDRSGTAYGSKTLHLGVWIWCWSIESNGNSINFCEEVSHQLGQMVSQEAKQGNSHYQLPSCPQVIQTIVVMRRSCRNWYGRFKSLPPSCTAKRLNSRHGRVKIKFH